MWGWEVLNTRWSLATSVDMRGILQDFIPLWIWCFKTKTLSESWINYKSSLNNTIGWLVPELGACLPRYYLCSHSSWWDSIIYFIMLRLHKNSRLDLQSSTSGRFFFHIIWPSSYSYSELTLVAWKSHYALPTAHNHNYAGDYWANVCSGLHAITPANMLMFFLTRTFPCCNCSEKSRYLQKRQVNWFRSWCSETSDWDRHEYEIRRAHEGASVVIKERWVYKYFIIMCDHILGLACSCRLVGT